MRMTSTTVRRAGGLLLQEMDLSRARCFRDFEVEAPIIVFWEFAEAEIQLQQTCSSTWRYTPRPHSLDLYGPGTYCSYTCTTGRQQKLVGYLPTDWQRGWSLEEESSGAFGVRTRMQYQDRVLERLLQQLRSHFAQGEPMGSLYSEMLALAVAEQIALSGGSTHGEPPARFLKPRVRRRVEELIEDRLEDPPSIEQMAMLAGMGTGQFLRAFKSAFAITPHQYLMNRRIEKAKASLGAGHETLSELAARLGFANHAHFTTVFRARTGSTPSDYRRGRCEGVS